jgi:hypothetical protein
MGSDEIKKTDGRRGNKRKKSIPIQKPPEIERSNKPALNKAKRSRRKAYAKKAIKNVFGSEVEMFESLAKAAKKGSYNHMKLLTDFAYEEEKDTRVTNNAPVINFFNSTDVEQKVKDKIIDVTPEEDKDE